MIETRIALTERMRTLAQLAQAVSASLDVTAVLDAVVRAAIDLLPGAAARIWVAQDDRLVLRAEAGTSTAPTGKDITQLAIGQGLTGSVAACREPLVVADLQADDRLISAERAREQGWVSFIGIPLLARDRLVGMLALFTRHRHDVTGDEIETLATFGSQAALAIDDARLYAGEQARVRRLRALTRLNHLISSSLDSDALLQEIARAAAKLMEAPLASFWQADEAARTVTLITSSDPTIDETPRRTRVYGQGIIGWVAANREAVNIADVFVDGRSPALEWHRRHGFSSLFAMPVIGDGRLLAVLAINARRPLRIEDEDRNLLESFGAQAAIAIRNARLFAESERRRRTAEVLQRLSSELAQSLDLEEVGRRIVDSVRMLIDAPVPRCTGSTRGRAISSCWLAKARPPRRRGGCPRTVPPSGSRSVKGRPWRRRMC
jgi:GAF domain-containing protein